MSKQIWRKNFDIKRIDFQMPYTVLEEIYNSQIRFFKKAYIKQSLWVTENVDNTGTFFDIKELRSLINATIKKIINDPKSVDNLHKKTIAVNKKYYNYSKATEKLDLSKLTNKQLYARYLKFIEFQRYGHGMAIVTTWFLDSDGEDYTKFLVDYLTKQCQKFAPEVNAAVAFSVLSTPRQETLARVEEKELMRLLIKLKKNKLVWTKFIKTPLKDLKRVYASLPSPLQSAVKQHYLKWRWVPYTYNGPVYELDFYLELIGGLAREGVNPRTKLQEFRKAEKAVSPEQNKLYKKLQINKKHQHYFKIAQDIIFIKGFRKDCLFLGAYARDLILAEKAKRVGLSTMQIKYLFPSEIKEALENKVLPSEIPDARMKFSVIATTNGKNVVYVGEAAKKLLAIHEFEKIEVAPVGELKGTCACPGQATGKVKIINLPEEMGKMNKGDIMVSHTTFPSLVPAMRKAAAIVTEDGGITCHAAIVSRELKIPCVVGIRGLTRILKDGDLVEVDAARGLVIKIN